MYWLTKVCTPGIAIQATMRGSASAKCSISCTTFESGRIACASPISLMSPALATKLRLALTTPMLIHAHGKRPATR